MNVERSLAEKEQFEEQDRTRRIKKHLELYAEILYGQERMG